jgi:uncharacterized protein
MEIEMTTFVPADTAVWFEIPVSDFDRARAFYANILKSEIKVAADGPNPMAVFVAKDQCSVAGHLYPGTPAARGTGSTIHLAVAAPLEEALERVTANGGEVVSPIVTIPAGRFAYCLDLDGNSCGLFN